MNLSFAGWRRLFVIAGFIKTEKNYRRIMHYQELWMLKAALDESLEDDSFAKERKCG